ncbi:MAG: hypothetical protein MJ168_11390 [Clostridia bacterium]|nr:hypothetical protein [Clostridia bacterium]
MKFSNWMSCIKDEVKLTDVVMPGSHNAGSRRMITMACCQSSTLAEQFRHGVRQFCLRLTTSKITKKIVFCHSVITGVSLEGELKELRKAMDENPSEFVILDVREYGDEKLGPITFRYRADPKEVDLLFEKYLGTSEYALTEFEDIRDVTMGDIRKSGKRFMIINEEKKYRYSVNCGYKNPWSPERHGRLAPTFVERATEVFDSEEKDGIFVLQTQQTAGFGTEVKLAPPNKLDKIIKPYYPRIFEIIKSNPKYLSLVNVVSSDFMAENDYKIKLILELNLYKNNVAEVEKMREIIG